MKLFAAVLLFTINPSCWQDGEPIDPQTFRREFDTVVPYMATPPVHTLGSIKFRQTSISNLHNEHCAQKGLCNGSHKQSHYGSDHDHNVWLPPLPADRCDVVDGTTNKYGYIVMHEILHAQHMDHGPEFKRILLEFAYIEYRYKYCSHLDVVQ